mmetsp:Transcript_92923/g.277308  ORF Transcript_92923/g.277308 Transcript_92923/m.277308 type:complete len:217 (-) Transcript_92923:24-674(-)
MVWSCRPREALAVCSWCPSCCGTTSRTSAAQLTTAKWCCRKRPWGSANALRGDMAWSSCGRGCAPPRIWQRSTDASAPSSGTWEQRLCITYLVGSCVQMLQTPEVGWKDRLSWLSCGALPMARPPTPPLPPSAPRTSRDSRCPGFTRSHHASRVDVLSAVRRATARCTVPGVRTAGLRSWRGGLLESLLEFWRVAEGSAGPFQVSWQGLGLCDDKG